MAYSVSANTNIATVLPLVFLKINSEADEILKVHAALQDPTAGKVIRQLM
jgi:hypothetical protein